MSSSQLFSIDDLPIYVYNRVTDRRVKRGDTKDDHVKSLILGFNNIRATFTRFIFNGSTHGLYRENIALLDQVCAEFA